MSFTEDEIAALGPVLMQGCLESTKGDEEIGPVYSADGKLLGTLAVRVRHEVAAVCWPRGDENAGNLWCVLRFGDRWVLEGDPADLAKHSRFTPAGGPQ